MPVLGQGGIEVEFEVIPANLGSLNCRPAFAGAIPTRII
jgi:hypothetical protein